MAKIVTVEQMRQIEAAADASGLTYDDMMENAGRAVAEIILERWSDIEGRQVMILVGSGNNGGDGLVAGRYLAEAGAHVTAYLTKERKEDDPNLRRLRDHEVVIENAEQDQRLRVLRNLAGSTDIVLDAVLGTGFQLPLKGMAKKVLRALGKALEKRENRPFVVAIDCPSGLDCESGELADETLICDLTITLAAAKPGLLHFPGAGSTGELYVADIGIPEKLKEITSVEIELATKEMIRGWLPARPDNAHKGTFGRALIVAGSVNFPGAAVLAGIGAYRVGAGLVTLAVPAPVQSLLASQLPEATWVILPHEMGVFDEGGADILREELKVTQSLLLGPGFGQETSTRGFLQRLLGGEGGGPRGRIGFIHDDRAADKQVNLKTSCVVDADGLKLLKQITDWQTLLPKDSVLTPHPGEMALLTDQPKDEIQADRVASTKHWSEIWGHIVVLKGAFTVVASPDGRTAVLPFATPALSRAGTGDVLAGVIVGLQAQGVRAFESAVLGSFLHGRAGELAAEKLGTSASVIASDVANALPIALSELENFAAS